MAPQERGVRCHGGPDAKLRRGGGDRGRVQLREGSARRPGGGESRRYPARGGGFREGVLALRVRTLPAGLRRGRCDSQPRPRVQPAHQVRRPPRALLSFPRRGSPRHRALRANRPDRRDEPAASPAWVRPRQGSVLLSGVSHGGVPSTRVFPSWRLDEEGGAGDRGGSREPARRGDASAEQRRYMLHRPQTGLWRLHPGVPPGGGRDALGWEGPTGGGARRRLVHLRGERRGRGQARGSREVHVWATCAPGWSCRAVVRGWERLSRGIKRAGVRRAGCGPSGAVHHLGGCRSVLLGLRRTTAGYGHGTRGEALGANEVRRSGGVVLGEDHRYSFGGELVGTQRVLHAARPRRGA